MLTVAKCPSTLTGTTPRVSSPVMKPVQDPSSTSRLALSPKSMQKCSIFNIIIRVCGYFCKIIKFLLTVRLTVSLQIADSFFLLRVSRGETIMRSLTQNDHRKRGELLSDSSTSGSYMCSSSLCIHITKRLDMPVLQQTHLLWLRVATFNFFLFYDPLHFAA